MWLCKLLRCVAVCCRRKGEELSGSVACQELQQLREVSACVWHTTDTCLLATLTCVLRVRTQEFAAYKDHMSSLLEQERGLNRKLRRMIE